MDQGFFRAAPPYPKSKRAGGKNQNNRHENSGDLIDFLLHRRFRRLRAFNKADHACKDSFCTNGRGAHNQAPIEIGRATNHRITDAP